MMKTTAQKRLARRAYMDRQTERQFVREVLSRRVTPEVEARLAEAAQVARTALEAPFLAKFLKPSGA